MKGRDKGHKDKKERKERQQKKEGRKQNKGHKDERKTGKLQMRDPRKYMKDTKEGPSCEGLKELK